MNKYTVTFFTNGYGQQPADLVDISVLPELPILEEDGFTFEGWYLDEDLTTLAEVGMEVTSDITLYASWSRNRVGWGSSSTEGDAPELSTYAVIGPGLIDSGGGGITAKWVPWPYTIQKGALPTWHDLYVKDSTDEVNLDDIAVSITESDISTYGYNSSSNYYQTTSWLCTDNNLVGSNVPKVPNYLVGNTRGLVCKGCELNVSEGSHSHYAQLVSDGTLTRTSGGKLTYSKTDGTEMVIFEKDAPYLFYFELVGAGGGGGSSTGNIASRYDGSGGGSGSVIAGILNFTKYSSYQFTIGKGGSGGVKNSNGAAATNGTASSLTVNAYTITVPGGSYGQNGGSTAGAGGTASTFYMVDSSGTPLSTLTLQSTRYYPEMGVWILVTLPGNGGGPSVKDGGGDGANPPYFSNTSTIFGTRSIGLCICSQQGSGGVAGDTAFGDDIYSNGFAGTLGGGGGGGIYANASNHNGGAGGSGVLYLIY